MDKTRDSTNSKILPDLTCAISVRRKGQILLVVESLVLSTTAKRTNYRIFTTKTSLQKLAKIFKQFSSYDETLITGALSSTSLSEEKINELTNLTTQMITFCKENKCKPDNTAEHECETGKRTKRELFQLFLSKFKKDQLSYEHQETLDKFEVNVPEYLSFHNKLRSSLNIGEFESYLTTVTNMEGKLNRLYLLTISDRG